MQQTSTNTAPAKKRFDTKMLVSTAMMIALLFVMWNTPLGRIPLPMVSITIAHIPILIAALTLGLYPGLIVSLAFGLMSLFTALTSPVSYLDPFFVNPLISVLPRLMIPVTAYFSYKLLHKLMGKTRAGTLAATGISVAIGNLTNTFGVYAMLYLVYARQILTDTGDSAINLIISLLTTTTTIKCIGVVLITTPVIAALKKILKYQPA